MAYFNAVNDFSTGMAMETLRTLLGKRLGGGAYRDVFEMAHNPELVVKVESADSRQFSNVNEWTLWNEVGDDPVLSKWFAPCVAISDNGNVLIQRRTIKLHDLPDELPDIFADVKLENFGALNGRVVMHDYANHRVFTRGLRRWKLIPVSRI